MSHEIRTPMNGILGFTGILHNDNISKEKKESYLTYIESSTRRLLSILNNIILFSRIEAGEISVKVTEFNLNDLLSELITEVRLKAVNENKQGLKINLNMEFPDENSIISSDKEKLSQILWHLLDNAVKFTDEGFIELGYYLNQLNNTLYFYVKDTGIGILKSRLAIIFEKFRQEDESHTRRFGGTGLGLAITKKLTDLIGGELMVESRKNKGSIFFFELPFNPVKLQSAKKAATEHVPLAVEDYDWHDKNILIVEDEEANFHYFKAILHSTRAIIHYAKSGKIALEKARENKNLDLVLMDIKLPDINGYEVTRQIKEIRNIPVIAQTAYAYPEDEEEAFLAGCDDFITKPIDKDKLLGKIQRLLDTMK
jgi:CheY-like chemotaxis protein